MNVIKNIFDEKIYAVVRAKKAKQVYEISKALIDGGIKIIELPLNDYEVLGVIKKLANETNASISAGGIITMKQAELAFDHGASMLVTPIFQQGIIKFSQSHNIPVVPTVATANEAYTAWKARSPLIKIYPAKHMGGVNYLQDLLRPMPFLNLMPTGNILVDEIPEYLECGAMAVGVGAGFYQDSSLDEIKEKAEKAVELVKKFKK